MAIGIDLGSRTIKLAVIRDGEIVDQQLTESGFDPYSQAREMLKRYGAAKIVATGYGRHLAHEHFADEVITEIKAHALGARYFFRSAVPWLISAVRIPRSSAWIKKAG